MGGMGSVAVVHALTDTKDRKTASTKCGKTVPLDQTTVWHREATCKECLKKVKS